VQKDRAGEDFVPPNTAAHPVKRQAVQSSTHEVESQRSPTFTIEHAAATIDAERREASLVLRFAEWLQESGCAVTAHHYHVTEPPLRNDLFDETAGRLWEAKGVVSRTGIRMAIGQLQDYRRFEPDSTRLGVLLPREPSEDLQELLATFNAAIAWPSSDCGFKVVEPPS
jgi:hypothetical protein